MSSLNTVEYVSNKPTIDALYPLLRIQYPIAVIFIKKDKNVRRSANQLYIADLDTFIRLFVFTLPN
jgi:hypothetical protein